MELIEHFNEDLTDAAGAVFFVNGLVVIWIKEFTYENLDYLVHECVHAANIIFQVRGHKISTDNDEAQAYLVQWIFSACIGVLKRKK